MLTAESKHKPAIAPEWCSMTFLETGGCSAHTTPCTSRPMASRNDKTSGAPRHAVAGQRRSTAAGISDVQVLCTSKMLFWRLVAPSAAATPASSRATASMRLLADLRCFSASATT